MIVFLILLAGFVSGMLVNYLADVLPLRRRLTKPFCLTCEDEQNWANYLIWPRHCPSCGHRRSRRTWIVEILYVSASLWLWLSPPSNFNFTIGLILLIYFGIVTVIDLEYRLILHPVSLFGAALGLFIGIYLHGVKSTLLGGVVGFSVMFLLYYLGILFMRWLSRRRGEIAEDEEAIGFGDVNLSGVIGLLLGWPGIVAGLILTILLAGVVSFIYLLFQLISRRYQAFMAIPYGPFLVASAVILLYFIDTFKELIN
ncbi:MAG: prepilin peptidase [Anaerolineales bacterium]|nr:prepilin peptidase [Anaerolineales bacterium]